tara:strand:+ start:743 stop:1204 length:462 start_codon:yes stop_codon:yes gene_type:complete
LLTFSSQVDNFQVCHTLDNKPAHQDTLHNISAGLSTINSFSLHGSFFTLSYSFQITFANTSFSFFVKYHHSFSFFRFSSGVHNFFNILCHTLVLNILLSHACIPVSASVFTHFPVQTGSDTALTNQPHNSNVLQGRFQANLAELSIIQSSGFD